MKTQELNIEGMHCHHCVMAVKKELGKVKGIMLLEVRIGKARVSYEEGTVTREALEAAVDEAGYRLLSIT